MIFVLPPRILDPHRNLSANPSVHDKGTKCAIIFFICCIWCILVSSTQLLVYYLFNIPYVYTQLYEAIYFPHGSWNHNEHISDDAQLDDYPGHVWELCTWYFVGIKRGGAAISNRLHISTTRIVSFLSLWLTRTMLLWALPVSGL